NHPRVGGRSPGRAQARGEFRRNGHLRPLRAVHRRHRQHLLYPDHHLPVRLRAPARLQPRHRVQSPVVGGAPALLAPPRDERQSPVVPRDVDVLGAPIRRLSLPAIAAILAACSSSTGSSPQPYVVVLPLVATLFAGDRLAARRATYYDAGGTAQPGTATWSSSAPGVATVNAATGAIHAVGAGSAVITATIKGTAGEGLVIVTAPLSLTLLLDTIVLLPQDTLVVPAVVR